MSGSDDGIIRVWNTKTCNVVHAFKHAKGICVVSLTGCCMLRLFECMHVWVGVRVGLLVLVCARVEGTGVVDVCGGVAVLESSQSGGDGDGQFFV